MKQLLGYTAAVAFSLGIASADFRVYAPSSESGDFWILDAIEVAEGLKFEVNQKVHIGIPMNRLTAHPTLPIFYVAASSGEPGMVPGVAIYTDRKGGEYSKNQPLTLAHGYSYLSTDREANFLMGAFYKGGQVDVYNIDSVGAVGDRIAYLDEGRNNAHCIIPTPDNRFVYIPYVKDDNAIYQYAFDAESGQLTALEPKNANPPEGAGPRHLAYHPEKPIIYFSNEQHMGISAYDIGEDGQLTLREMVDSVPADFDRTGHSASDIVITEDGKFIFVGIRSTATDFDRIARYRVEDEGDAVFLGMTKVDDVPWGLELSPGGQILLVASAGGKSLVAYLIGDDGDLKDIGRYDWGEKITDLIAQ